MSRLMAIDQALEYYTHKVDEALAVLMHVLVDDNYSPKECHEVHEETARRIKIRERIQQLNDRLAQKKTHTATD